MGKSMVKTSLVTKTISLTQPRKLLFGNGCSMDIASDIASSGKERIFIVLSKSVKPTVKPILETLEKKNISTYLWTNIDSEPTIPMFEKALKAGQEFGADAVVGIGGGSVLDVAKLVAALLESKQKIKDIIGKGNLKGRSIPLYCLPTTAGTGSEVSPNAILLDKEENLKKGIISPFLVPDATYVDPELTKTVPPSITAATGLDALTHCIEAYANRFAHPMVDLYALEGIMLIGYNLQQAVDEGNDIDARTNMALGSMYGGLCLGPVNTAAVHALSYPLGSEYHIAHGISNALLLPHVLKFNLEAAPARYARIAEALGVERDGKNDLETAQKGVEKISVLMKNCGVPIHMSQIDIPKKAIRHMAETAMSVTRLLKNNLRQLTEEDAKKIYEAAY